MSMTFIEFLIETAGYRSPKTQAERKANTGAKVRQKRKKLPSDWDDEPITTQRSWKKYRKTQYK